MPPACLLLAMCTNMPQMSESAAPAAPARSDTDMAGIMLDSYRRQQTPVAWSVTIHADPQVGQRADWGTFRWTVVSVADGLPIVEHSFDGYAIAYQLDPSQPTGQPNVLRAWIGRHGARPEEIEITQPPAQRAARRGPEPKVVESPFEALDIGERQWSGTLTTVTVTVGEVDFTTRSWRSGQAWFDGTIQTESAGKLTCIRLEEQAAPDLRWP